MQLVISDEAKAMIEDRGGVVAIDYIPPIG
jgi:hypothetical protein